MDPKFDRCVDRNVKGQELERQGHVTAAITIYEANIADRFDGSHPYDRLRRIYFRNSDYTNVGRICRAYISFGQQDPSLKKEYQRQADGIDRFLSAENSRSIGNDNPICPHCAGVLPQMPTKSQKCVLCHKSFRIRIRPSDRKSVAVTLEQAEILDEQWAMVEGHYDEFQRDKHRHSRARAILTEKFGRAPSEGDVEWRLLNEDLLTSASEHDWPRYRNTKYGMAQVLLREKKRKDALATLLEICFLDINGPINVKDDRWRGVSESFGPWTPKFGHLVCSVVDRIPKAARAGELSPEAVHSLFVERATVAKKALHLPVTVDAAWDQLATALQKLAWRAQVS